MRPLYERSKWTKYQIMRRSSILTRHLPPTEQVSLNSFKHMLEEHGDIVVKPVGGSRGAKVVRITKTGTSSKCLVHIEKQQRTVSSVSQAYAYVSALLGKQNLIVQRRIPLATINGQPFDLRIIVQRRKRSYPWKVTGRAAKVAGEGYIVTNFSRSNGMVLPARTAIERSSLVSDSTSKVLSRIDRVAIRAAETLTNNKLYARQRIYGLDMGLDEEGNVWIIEANLKPMLAHFRKLKNKTMYHRIIKYKKGTVVRR